MKLGIDVGSTTVKLVLLDEQENVVYKKYERHMSSVFSKVKELLDELIEQTGDISVKTVITGSGGLSLADKTGCRFEQEVVTCSLAVKKLIPQTDVAIELGGEDAKITYFGASIEQRMNGTCAGGTGAFIDQMAILLNTDGSGLNEAAKGFSTIYPIAARCGVFAKTDIQPLINEGAPLEDLAVSIFQAVVNQTISGLACGHPISGNVAFLGGPLTYMSELRNRFIETLSLTPEQVIFPENSKYYVAIGACYMAENTDETRLSRIIENILSADSQKDSQTKHLEPLFVNEVEYESFKSRHALNKVKKSDLSSQEGPLFLGIDAGSTTTKAALINKNKELVYSFYRNNEGNPIEATKHLLTELYSVMPDNTYIAATTVTGYGEGLIKSGFNTDYGLIETIAHYKGAKEFLPGVDFILDIGGQDMKCMRIKDNAIYSIMLNEACSSGCGSFLETYAKSVDMSIQEFAASGIMAKSPVDLGTRCTVFMNSMVKQAQKEGAGIDDIAAGLCYSIIKNALYKVIKLRSPEEAGEMIVVQGGTFLNESVLRALEKVLGRNVVRPDISGIMGAYGCAVNSLENCPEGQHSSVLSAGQIDDFSVKSSTARCKGCENHCMLTVTDFKEGSRYVSGNRCEKGEGKQERHNDLPNLYEYKLHRLFDYEPLSEEKATRGHIAIPRVLNMYEDYPFWFTFFTELGYRVVLSPMSSKAIYQKGIDTISSDTACYPAKISHGHVKELVEMGEKLIFYPAVNYEYIEDNAAPNHYNCPIVATYPEVIANNMDHIFRENGVEFMHPFLPYDRDSRLIRRLTSIFSSKGIERSEISSAVRKARAEQLKYKKDVEAEGLRALKYAGDNQKKAIVLSGRPYHLDSEINHGIDKMIAGYDFVVLSEDSVQNLAELPRPLRVLDQWTYHSRLYKAANFVGTLDGVELVQLNSFGCGVDAVTTDEVEEICSANNKLYTVIKIDEGTNLGAVRIRIRSLKAALEERDRSGIRAKHSEDGYKRVVFTEDMRDKYTVIMPQMSPLHFDYLEAAVNSCGYNFRLVPPDNAGEAIQEGLKYVNNDACYPTLVTVGKMIAELKSGKYDLNRTAVVMSQTGGGCRASNYVSLIRKALKDLNMEQVPVISFNTGTLEHNPGFRITAKMAKRLLIAAIYGDLFQRLIYRTRPYEVITGSSEAIRERFRERIMDNCRNGSLRSFRKITKEIIHEYDRLPLTDEIRPKVGVVGEILVKYHPDANNHIVDIIEKEGGEAVVLEMVDFFLYTFLNKTYNYKYLSGTFKSMLVSEFGYYLVYAIRHPVAKELRKSRRFTAPVPLKKTAKEAASIASMGNQCGEGWLLTGEMIDLINQGAANIACLQPFACLPNHVTGKGMLKAIRERYPKANIVAIDYDPGASNVNQLNRIKLMLANARIGMDE